MVSQTTSSTTNRSNRRSSQRWPVVSFARIECRKGSYGFGQNITKTVVNLSETGMCIVTKGALKKNEEVEVLFGGLDSGRSLRRIGTVVWAEQDGTGGSRVGVHFQSPVPYQSLLRVVRTSS